MIVLPVPTQLNAVLLRNNITWPGSQDALNGLMSCLLETSIALRDDITPPSLALYNFRQVIHSATDLVEIANTITWYAPHVLNELVINNINNPYIVNTQMTGVTIANKEEYSNV